MAFCEICSMKIKIERHFGNIHENSVPSKLDCSEEETFLLINFRHVTNVTNLVQHISKYYWILYIRIHSKKQYKKKVQLRLIQWRTWMAVDLLFEYFKLHNFLFLLFYFADFSRSFALQCSQLLYCCLDQMTLQ